MVIAFLRPNPWFKRGRTKGENGNYNGYVAFKEDLPLSWQGGATVKDLEILDDLVDVHGGITFDYKIRENDEIIPLTAIPEDLHKYRVIGFDTAHHLDTAEEWTFEKTKKETLALKEQIEKLIKIRIALTVLNTILK